MVVPAPPDDIAETEEPAPWYFGLEADVIIVLPELVNNVTELWLFEVVTVNGIVIVDVGAPLATLVGLRKDSDSSTLLVSIYLVPVLMLLDTLERSCSVVVKKCTEVPELCVLLVSIVNDGLSKDRILDNWGLRGWSEGFEELDVSVAYSVVIEADIWRDDDCWLGGCRCENRFEESCAEDFTIADVWINSLLVEGLFSNTSDSAEGLKLVEVWK